MLFSQTQSTSPLLFRLHPTVQVLIKMLTDTRADNTLSSCFLKLMLGGSSRVEHRAHISHTCQPQAGHERCATHNTWPEAVRYKNT